MESPKLSFILSFLLLGLIASWASVQGQAPRVGFYSKTCPRVESIIKTTVEKHFKANPRVAPGLLRMHFHDCFVRGCDASVLLEGSGTEKTSFQNSGLPGYAAINEAKTLLEAACPRRVSCADIIAIAARDSVVLTKGFGWAVPTGRKDGRVSLVAEAGNLPNALEPMASQLKKFRDLGLGTQDMVALLGSHTIGTTSCGLAGRRLFGFNSSTGADPAINPSFVPVLRVICPQNGDGSRRVELDNGGSTRFDSRFYSQIRAGRAVIDSDSLLWTDSNTKPFVERFLGVSRGGPPLNFNTEFARSMIKMGNIVNSQGEIRRICTAIN